MSEAESALVRDVFDRWNRGEREFDESTLDPDFEVRSTLTGRTYAGREGIREWTTEIDEQFAAWKLVIEEIEGVGTGTLAVSGEIQMTGRESQVRFDQPASWLVELREARVLRISPLIGRNTAAQRARESAGG